MGRAFSMIMAITSSIRFDDPEPSKPVRPVAAVKPFQSKIDNGGALAKVSESTSSTTNDAGDVPTRPSRAQLRSQSLSSAGGSNQSIGGLARSRLLSLAATGNNTGGLGGVIDLTRSATPSPNRQQGLLSASSTGGFNRRGDYGNGFGPSSQTDSMGEVASDENFGAAEAKKKFTFKSRLSKSSAPAKGNNSS